MAYGDEQKQGQEEQRYFPEPLDLDEMEMDDAEEEEQYPEDPEEKRERRLGRLRLAAGVGDLFGVVAGSLIVLALLAVILSLISWVQQDITQTAVMLGSGL